MHAHSARRVPAEVGPHPLSLSFCPLTADQTPLQAYRVPRFCFPTVPRLRPTALQCLSHRHETWQATHHYDAEAARSAQSDPRRPNGPEKESNQRLATLLQPMRAVKKLRAILLDCVSEEHHFHRFACGIHAPEHLLRGAHKIPCLQVLDQHISTQPKLRTEASRVMSSTSDGTEKRFVDRGIEKTSPTAMVQRREGS